ncbi:MAG: 5-oxoprolinase subunit PxpB [Acidobacteriota bacterium]|nr:5-oxoprolinase subunit PxpB [Acidobacteriota bacterium]
MNYRIFPLGENAVTIDFGSEISLALNDKVLRLADRLARNSFAGFVELVPAYSSLTVFYDVFAVRKNFPAFDTAFEAVKDFLENALENSVEEIESAEPRLVKIPVSFAEDAALDLELVAAENNLTRAEVIRIFLSKTYRVFMLGFLPGFAYMGEIDERIAAPRKPAPRLKVPRGSVGIAERQTGVYPFESPGGWQIIGRTGIELFTPDAVNPTVLQPGDLVRFYEDQEIFTTRTRRTQRKKEIGRDGQASRLDEKG